MARGVPGCRRALLRGPGRCSRMCSIGPPQGLYRRLTIQVQGRWKCVELPGEETYRRWIYYPGNELDDFDPATTTFAQRALRGQREPTDQMLSMISTSLNRSDISPSFIAWVEGCHAE